MAPSIDAIKSLTSSGYVMTCSKQSASINLWTSVVGLNLAGGYNFKRQAATVKDSTVLCKLDLESLANVYEKDGVTILMRKSYQPAYQALEADQAAKEKAKEESNEEEKTGEHVGKPLTAAAVASLPVPDSGETPLNPSPTWSHKDKDEEEDGDTFDLGGLFNEAEGQAEDYACGDVSSDGEDDEFGGPNTSEASSFAAAWFSQPKQAQEEPKEEAKKAPFPLEPKEKKQPKDPKAPAKKPEDEAKVVNELVMMGFPHSAATQAFKKCKTSVIGDVLDIIVQLQAA